MGSVRPSLKISKEANKQNPQIIVMLHVFSWNILRPPPPRSMFSSDELPHASWGIEAISLSVSLQPTPASIHTVTPLSMKHPCMYQYPYLLFTFNIFIKASVNGIAHQNFHGHHLANNITKIFSRFIFIYVYVSACCIFVGSHKGQDGVSDILG